MPMQKCLYKNSFQDLSGIGFMVHAAYFMHVACLWGNEINKIKVWFEASCNAVNSNFVLALKSI